MEQGKGTCKHGEFDLDDGCPQCIKEFFEERKRAETAPAFDTQYQQAAEVLLEEVLTLETSPETVAVKVAPGSDEGYNKLLTETVTLLGYSSRLVIRGYEDKKAATNDLVIMAELGKQIDVMKKERLGPIDEKRKAEFDKFKQLTDPLAQAVSQTKAAMLAYDMEQERRRLELEDIARKEREVEEAKALVENRAPVEVKTVVVPEPGSGQTRGDIGMTSTVITYKAKVINFALLSDDYKLSDMAKLNRVVNAAKGKIEIPGIEIETERNLRTRR